MNTNTLLRIGGGAAVLAGVLRAVASFGPGGSEVERQSLYLVIDLLLLLGLFTAYAQNHVAVGRWGATGFLTAVAGILVVRSSRAVPGLDLYPAGALAVAIGWVLLSTVWWRKAHGAWFVPLLLVLSLMTGLVGQIAQRSAGVFVASGVIFGAAMIGVGYQVLLTAAAAPRNEASNVEARAARGRVGRDSRP